MVIEEIVIVVSGDHNEIFDNDVIRQVEPLATPAILTTIKPSSKDFVWNSYTILLGQGRCMSVGADRTMVVMLWQV